MKKIKKMKNYCRHFFSREPQSQAELMAMLRLAQKHEIIDHDALKMIEGVLAVSAKKVRDIMVPKSQMVMLNANESAENVLPLVMQAQHSRFPVFGDNEDKVLGILLAKDLLSCFSQKKEQSQIIHQLTRPAVLIPESKRLDVLLKEFRQSHQHMAIVVDEYGAVSGLITIEDVLEEIVGDIRDEYDIDENELLIKPVGDMYLVSALTPIVDFNHYFSTHFSDSDVDTIGGLVIQKFSYLPKRHEKIIIDQFEVTVIKATRRGILTLQFKLLQDNPSD